MYQIQVNYQTIQKKCKETYINKYGVDHYSKTEEFKESIQLNRINKWGTFIPNSITFLDLKNPSSIKEELYNDPNQLIHYKCNECSLEESIPTETIKWRINKSGTCCRECSGIKSGSIPQKQIDDFIKSLGIATIYNDKNILDNLEIDIFIPSMNIGIEYNGLYWHNDLHKDKRYHIEKLNHATQNGITLIQIFEDEWIHNEEIVKSRLKYILNKIDTKIFARKCIIKEISAKECIPFLNENHIQGTARSSIKLGLFFDDELMSVMTFSIPTKAKGQQAELGFWELSRFCNRKNTTIIGGAGKLFKYFIKTYDPLKILSFADKRWSTGTLYDTLGFEYNGNTEINYWYIDKRFSKRIYRYALRKTKDDDQPLSEYENRIKQGYTRIWDCGSLKYTWHKP